MKVVIDTNILIGGAYDESSISFKIVNEVIEGRLKAYATHQTMRENRLLLRKIVSDREYKELFEKYFRALQIVRRTEKLDVVGDKEDNKLFESAVSAGAQYLITSDREVLDIEEYERVSVVHPGDFWAIYSEQTGAEDQKWKDWGKIVLGK